MAYIWSYLRRYPKWLAMNFTAAILFVIANLGLPTVLARMIDDGFQCLFDFDDKSIFGCSFDWDCWSYTSVLCSW